MVRPGLNFFLNLVWHLEWWVRCWPNIIGWNLMLSLDYLQIIVTWILGRECSMQSHFLWNVYANKSTPMQIFIHLQILENGTQGNTGQGNVCAWPPFPRDPIWLTLYTECWRSLQKRFHRKMCSRRIIVKIGFYPQTNRPAQAVGTFLSIIQFVFSDVNTGSASLKSAFKCAYREQQTLPSIQLCGPTGKWPWMWAQVYKTWGFLVIVCTSDWKYPHR